MKSKKQKTLISILLCVIMLTSIFSGCSTATTVSDGTDTSAENSTLQTEIWQNLPATEGLKYTLNEDKQSYSAVGMGTATNTDIVISSIYQGKPVTGIETGAFCENEKLKSVFIPDSIKTIGNLAFYNCSSLEAVTMAPSVKTIGTHAFAYCEKLEKLSMPNDVRHIGSEAFYKCMKLLDGHDGVFYIGNWCIDYDGNSTEVIIRDGTVGISDGAFWLSNLEDGDNNMEKITLPPTLKYIGEDAFVAPELKEVHISDLAAWCRIDFGDNPVNEAHVLYLDGEIITSLIIPEEITVIPSGAFDYCYEIKDMTVHSNVTKLLDVPLYCKTITYSGTTEQWDKIERYKYKFDGVVVNCTDGIGDNTIIVEE